MNPGFPEYNHADLQGDPTDQIYHFDDILNESESLGIIDTTPKNEDESYKDPNNNVRLRTVASRLYLLGYLKKKFSPHKLDSKKKEISQAVLQFQSDAGIKSDNWIGDKTWHLLDELVSFESDLSDHWFINEDLNHSTALNRAIQLRLFSLGLVASKPGISFEKIQPSGLNNFLKILKIFLIYNVSELTKLNKTIVNLLFDQDKLIQSISNRATPQKRSFHLFLNAQNKKSDLSLAQKFICSNVKIELWLLGFDVKIDGKNDYLTESNSKLKKAIKIYLKEIEGLSNSKSIQQSRKITPLLIDSIARYSNLQSDSDVSNEVLSVFNSSAEIEDAWSNSKSMGMRLWDGLKRVWRWFKKIGKKIFNFLKDNIFKAFFRYAAKAFKIIKNGTKAIVKSIEIYLKGGLQESGIFFNFSKDMDTRVHIPDDSTTDYLENSIKRLSKQSKSFNIACRILSWIIKIFKSLVQGYFGWARLLFALIKSYKKLRILYLDFKSVALA